MEREQLLEDLLTAYYDARKHKRNTHNQLRFEINMEHEIISLCDEILNRTYEPRPSICFIINDPVKREVFAADFRDRVVHHLIFNYINPMLDPQFIPDSYSCRKGKGTLYGIRRVADFIGGRGNPSWLPFTCAPEMGRTHRCAPTFAPTFAPTTDEMRSLSGAEMWIMKLDIQGYFMSINKQLLWHKLQAMLVGANPCGCPVPRGCPVSGNHNDKNNGAKNMVENRAKNISPLRVRNTQGKHVGLPQQGFSQQGLPQIWYLLEKTIFNDPRNNCIFKSRKEEWADLPSTKSLFNAAPDCGLPIGNLTSQLFSNVYLHDFDVFVTNVGAKYLSPAPTRGFNPLFYGRYVDDFILIHPDKEFLLACREKIRDYLHKESGLTLHPKKFYLQQSSKGVSFLGAYIKPNRMYVGNRTKGKFLRFVGETNNWVENRTNNRAKNMAENRAKNISPLRMPEQIRATVNSYLGLMRHFASYNIRKKALLERTHGLFRYGYFMGGLCKYVLTNRITE
jgi:retron-type reverse transcriptase